MKKLFLITTLILSFVGLQAQESIPLYKGKAPGSENWQQKEAKMFSDIFQTEVVYNVTNPSILVYKANAEKTTGSVIIIAPGGGFQSLSINREGIELAKKLAENGITAVVLKYRLLETKSNDPAREMMENLKNRDDFDKKTAIIKTMAGQDIRTAISYIRSHSKELNIQPNKLGVIGFSAGANVILESVLKSETDATLPNFAASLYGAPSNETLALNVPKNPLPLFICAASNDQLQLAPKSILLYNRWLEAKQPVELHMFEKGGHGFGMGVQNLPVDHWIDFYFSWLKEHKYL